jgi:regulator of protease activity HflC (stomatin/prohibitin superfamily)
MNIFRASLVGAAVLTSWGALAQDGTVRIITPDGEHVYSADPRAPQQLPDDEVLRLQNERADRARNQRIENARRQEELAAEQARLNAEAAQAAARAHEEQQVGYIGTLLGIRYGRHFILRRPSTIRAVSGSPSPRMQTGARGLR